MAEQLAEWQLVAVHPGRELELWADMKNFRTQTRRNGEILPEAPQFLRIIDFYDWEPPEDVTRS